MTRGTPLHGKLAPRWKRQWVVLAGGTVIAAVAAAGVYDIVTGYGHALDQTDRQLESQARSLAEQTARTLDTVDIILRHAASRYQRIGLPEEVSPEIHEYLATQAGGVVQIEGLEIHHANGTQLGASCENPPSQLDLANRSFIAASRDDPSIGL